jgi:prepilin-type processing-associated H-X9-DG protein
VYCAGIQRPLAQGLLAYVSDNDRAFPIGLHHWRRDTTPKDDTTAFEGLAAYIGAGDDPPLRWDLDGHPDETRYVCTSAVAERWRLSRQVWAGAYYEDSPTFTVNRWLMPRLFPLESGTLQSNPEATHPRWDWLPQRLPNVRRAAQTWTFADGPPQGVFFTSELAHPTQRRFYWQTHLGGANVAYLDGRVDWIDAEIYFSLAVEGSYEGWMALRDGWKMYD